MAGTGEAQNTVLVAEEDPELRERVVSYLEAHGLIATVVDSVAAARGALRQNAYGGVILNSTLKGEDCLVIARELLARADRPSSSPRPAPPRWTASSLSTWARTTIS